MSSQPISLGGDLHQYSRELSHRIHTAKVYPLTASNGSTVVVYGHENGVCFVWRVQGQSAGARHEARPAFASVIHTVNVYLGGAEALYIDFPKLATTLHHDTRSIPTLLSQRIVVGVACSDYGVRVISLPLTPSGSEDRSEQVLRLVGEPSHQSIPTCVSVTFTPRQSSADANAIVEHSTTWPTSRVSHQASEEGNAQCDLLVASASSDLSGRLMVHRVPCGESCLDDSVKYSIPWKVHCLASPAVSLSFSSAVYPSSHHLQLLIAEAQGRVRIEDYLPEIHSPRRSQSVYADFGFSSGQPFSKAKRILDCRWLLEGKSIAILLTTGEWFIWDITNAGPHLAAAPSQKGVSMSGSQIAISGWIQAKAVKSSTNDGDSNGSRSKFAPMTPSTRRIRQATLFASDQHQPLSPQHGGISIIPSPPMSSYRGDDSCVLFWHGTTINIIPSFLTYWQNQVRGSANLFGPSPKGEMKIIDKVRFSGETCREVTLDPCSSELGLIVTAGHRLILIESTSRQKRRLSATPQALPDIASTDQGLLTTGELDLLGMNHVLESMSNGNSLEEISTQRNVKWTKAK